MNIHNRISSHYSSWPSPHGNQDVARQITNKLLAIWFNWDPTFFRKMDDSLQQKKRDGDCGVFVCLEMRFILLSRLFRADTSRSSDMGIISVEVHRATKLPLRV